MGKFLSQNEVEERIRFDLARLKYINIYGSDIFINCESCGGTGLLGVQLSVDGNKSWSGTYCELCDGFGGRFILNEIIFECEECKDDLHPKSKCSKCAGTGYVDWIENLMFVDNNYSWYSRFSSTIMKNSLDKILVLSHKSQVERNS